MAFPTVQLHATERKTVMQAERVLFWTYSQPGIYLIMPRGVAAGGIR